VGLERGPFSLVSTIEELLEIKSSGSGLESQEYGRRDPSRGTLYPQKLAMTSPANGGRSVDIVRSRTQATEFSFLEIHDCHHTISGCNSNEMSNVNTLHGRKLRIRSRTRDQSLFRCKK
jgi:hypothetical protein